MKFQVITLQRPPRDSGKRCSNGYDPAMKSLVFAPEGHSVVVTEDGSVTLFSHAFGEACHSTTGAKSETILHYINGCEILEKLKTQEEITILEIGFGLGIGFLSTLEQLPPGKKLTFVSVELDRNLLEWFREIHSNHKLLRELQWAGNILEVKTQNVSLQIIQGDARKTLPEYLRDHNISFDAIYQDAFSPRRNPVLWTVEWFLLLKSASKENVILSTYSASSSIRKSLLTAGWNLQKGEKFGPKRTSTRASLNRPSDPEILAQLERSPTPAITDLLVPEFKNKIEE